MSTLRTWAAFAASTSLSLSPIIHERAGSMSSSPIASSSIPGAGLRQRQAGASGAGGPSGGGAQRGGSRGDAPALGGEQLEHAGMHGLELLERHRALRRGGLI